MISIDQHIFPLSVFLAAVGIGIELEWRNLTDMLAKPKTLALGTLVHTLVFPVVAASLVGLIILLQLDVSEALLAGILLIAACPSGGFSNILVLVARANLALSVILTFVSSILSFLTVPLLVVAFGLLLPALSANVSLPVGQTLVQLFLLVVLPVFVGMAWRRLQPFFVARHMVRYQKWSQNFMYLIVLIVTYQRFDVIGPVFLESFPWALALSVLALGGCFGLARLLGLSANDAVTTALEGTTRNLAVAFLIAITVLDRPDIAALPSVYFVFVIVVGFGFAMFWKSYQAKAEAQPHQGASHVET